MSDVSSVQTIGRSIDLASQTQYNNHEQPLTYQPLAGGTGVNDGVKVSPLEINITGVSEVGELSVPELISKSIAEVDTNYNKIINRVNDWPSFDTYLEDHGISLGGTMDKEVGISHISNVDELKISEGEGKELSMREMLNKSEDKMKALHEEQTKLYSAGVEYAKDSTVWSMSTTFWLSKMKILTSAVSQANSGLKTLFMSQ